MASTTEFESEMSATINSDELPNTISKPDDAVSFSDIIYRSMSHTDIDV